MGERKQTSPHYSLKSNPALTSWLERAYVPNHVSTQWNTSTRTHGGSLWCMAALSYHTIHCLYTFEKPWCTNTAVNMAFLPPPLHCPLSSCGVYTPQTCFVLPASQFLCLSGLMRWKISLRHTRETFRVSSMQSNSWCKIAADRASGIYTHDEQKIVQKAIVDVSYARPSCSSHAMQQRRIVCFPLRPDVYSVYTVVKCKASLFI